MPEKDFILTWDWEHDAGFIKKFEEICNSKGVSGIFTNPSNLAEVFAYIKEKRVKFKVLLDRASDTDAAFDPLIDKIIFSGTKTLNEARHSMKAMDKATMHLEFLTKSIDVPQTIIFSAVDDTARLNEKALEKLSRPFIIKPAHGGGGEGVREAWNIADVRQLCGEHGEEKYLLQEKVFADNINGKPAYFRIYYVCGQIIPCWWNNQTHEYGNAVNRDEERIYGLVKLKDIVKQIADISNLDFFSTEICITDKRRFVVVDYVNDPCDMRLKSAHHDGVSDQIVEKIIKCIIRYIEGAKTEELTPLRKKIISRRRDFELKLLRRYR